MKVIGVTGPTGAGKSLICEYFEKLNIPCINADRVYHELLLPPSECLDAIRTSFGSEVFCADGKLDRAALAAIVFANPDKLNLLNRTVLGRVICRLRTMISDYRRKGFDTVVVDGPTLIESGFHKECSAVIGVLAPEEERLKRIIERDCLSLEKANERIKAQKSDSFYKEHSDYIIINNQSPEKLKSEVDKILSALGIVRKD